MSEPIQIVLSRLEQRGFDPRPVGPDSWESRCPAHDGSRRNLSIKIGDDGRCLVHCHHVDESGVNCPTEAILSAIGLTLSDLFRRNIAGSKESGHGKVAKPKAEAKPRTIHPTFEAATNAVAWGLSQPRDGKPGETWHYRARWIYRNADDVPLFAVARFHNADGDAGRKGGKDYRPIHKVGDGYAIGDPPGLLPLYRLPELAGCRRVYVPEGEKCADFVREIDLAATTPSHGAQSPHRSDWSPLAGIEVIILPDADSPGEGFARSVVAQLAKLDPAPTVRIVCLPGLGEGEDIEQWLQARGSDPGPDSTWRERAREELERLADSTPLTTPEPAATNGLAGLATLTPRPEDSRLPKETGEPTGPAWSVDPRPIRSRLLPVPPLPVGLIPGQFREWLTDIANRVSCSPDFPVVGAINSLASLVGRKVAIRPKCQDDWKVVPNLWGGIVGRPGVFKTPALQEAMKPLNRLAQEAILRFEEETAAFAGRSLLVKVQADQAKEAVKKAVRQKESESIIAELVASATAAEGLTSPVCKRYLLSDATVEKLGELLRDNPTGVMVFRDELTGWFRSLDKYGHESDRAFYLEAWNGTGAAFTYDRIGRGTVVIPSPCVSILGGIQPGPLRSYLKAVARGEDGDDGLISRFQLLVYPDPPHEWINVDRWPDNDAKNRAFAVFRRLDNLDFTGLGAEPDPEDGVPFFRFAPDAQALFDEWRGELENQKLRVEGESPMIESHLSKYRSLMPSLSLLFHLVDIADGGASGPVSLDAALLSAAWCDYLEAHARRIYSSLDEADNDAARALADRIRKGDLTGPFSARDVYRRGWSLLTNADDFGRAVAILEGLGWVQSVETHNTGGAPRTEVHIHPSLAKTRGMP